ncbi:MAG: hypothetical protein JO256_00855 [Alphaproteobacteria bacterium]|nr:hypothetical protein [Alphaproteobacteria bacterium]
MELPHETYFYALATVAITFAGFATILMALREGRGAGMSRFHLWVAKSYIQSGLVTAVSSMLPPLLFAFGIGEAATWRVSSIAIGLPALFMLMTAPRQWRAVTTMPIRMRLWVQISVGVVINGLLLLNAAGWPMPPAAGPVMLAVSWNLFGFFAQFAESVSFFFEDEDEN